MSFVVVNENNQILHITNKKLENSIEIEDKYLISNNIIECLQYKAIMKLKDRINEMYKKYVQKYPEIEVRSFNDKAREATLYMKNKQNNVDTSLEDTPYLSALVNNDINKRDALAEAIYAKVQEYAGIEKYGIEMRDKIKSFTTIEDLQKIIEGL